MKTIRVPVFWALAVALTCCSVDATALTMGRLKGSALLGQPLELVASFQLGPDEELTESCVEANVSYGDVRQSPGQTGVTLVPGPANQTLLAVISSSALVNEPVVTIELKAGCTQKTTRKFVLLSELATDPVARSQAGILSANVSPAAPAAGATATAPVAASSGVGAPAVAAVRPRPTVSTPPSSPAEKPVVTSAAKAKNNNRLASQALAARTAEAIEELSQRVDAVAQWQAEKSGAQESPSQMEAIDALQLNLKALQAVTLKNQKNIQAVASALDASESQRITSTLVYGLFALVGLACAALAYLLLKPGAAGHTPMPWWRAGSGAAARLTPAVNEGVAEAVAGVSTDPLPDAVKPPDASGKPTAEAQASSFSLTESAFAGLPQATPGKDAVSPEGGRQPSEAPGISQYGALATRAVNTREMFDVRQQAEFFMALGQHDEAIRVLERSHAESEGSNPLVLLDLLKILHTLSRRTEFDRYRAEFNAQFTGIVPSYTSFLADGSSLESYPDIVRQIVDLWPSDDTMVYLEQCMVRTPQDDPEQGFDLEAFRDLLTLHAVLRRLNTAVDSNLAPFSAVRTAPAELSADTASGDLAQVTGINSDMAPLPVLPVPANDPQVAPALDLDLTDNNGTNLMDFDVEGISGFNKPKA